MMKLESQMSEENNNMLQLLSTDQENKSWIHTSLYLAEANPNIWKDFEV